MNDLERTLINRVKFYESKNQSEKLRAFLNNFKLEIVNCICIQEKCDCEGEKRRIRVAIDK